MVFVLAITSARRALKLYVLCYTEPYIAVTDPMVLLCRNIEFLPKVNTPLHACQPIWIPSMHVSTDRVSISSVYVVPSNTTLNTRGHLGRMTDPYSSSYAKKDLGKPYSRQCLSRWLVKTIQFPYTVQNLPIPHGIKGHQTRKQTASIAKLAGPTPETICKAATWASTCTFPKFYQLNIAAAASADFGRRVLRVAGASSSSTQGLRSQTGGLAQYHIPKKRRH